MPGRRVTFKHLQELFPLTVVGFLSGFLWGPPPVLGTPSFADRVRRVGQRIASHMSERPPFLARKARRLTAAVVQSLVFWPQVLNGSTQAAHGGSQTAIPNILRRRPQFRGTSDADAAVISGNSCAQCFWPTPLTPSATDIAVASAGSGP